MGVLVTDKDNDIFCIGDNLHGATIKLSFPSVGATENIMLTAVLAKGETIINNAAREPEIVDLQKFLNGMGADVRGAGGSTIVIKGVESLHAVEHTVMPDRIVAGTYLVAAAITRGEIILHDVAIEDLKPINQNLKTVGCIIREEKNKIYLKAPEIIKNIKILKTEPHPGFPTDMQAQFMSMLAIANGESKIHETLFEARNKHIKELNKMGAHIEDLNEGQIFKIKGVKKLIGAKVSSLDLRGGAALILAGLAAEGETIVIDSTHVERGYEKIDGDLNSIGAKIKYMNT